MRKWFFILLLSLMTLNSNAQIMKLGDLNHDNQVNITDVITLVDIILHGYSSFDVSPTTVTMQAGGTTTLTIEGGYYYYEVESANPNIVTASLNNLTVTLTAVSGGETYVTVKDVLTFRTILIPVVVEGTILTVSTNSLSLNANETGAVEIKSGSGYYSVQSSDANVATATLSGSTVTVSAVGAGSATITLTDTKTDETAVIKVTVSVSPTYLTCPDDHHPHMIDLGLPSGTKWACCNVGADKPEGYGCYYGWGETEVTDYYDWSTYLHCDGNNESCHDIGSNIAGTQYDVAQSEWGNSWVMPSSEQIEELVEYCRYTWIKQNRVNGGNFTGPSGGSIFLPATGARTEDKNSGIQKCGSYWSSNNYTRYNYGYANSLYIREQDCHADNTYRCYGLVVRPVAAPTPLNELTLSSRYIKLYVGKSYPVEIMYGSGNYEISNSNPDVMSVSLSGTTITITGVFEGSATITVTDTKNGQTAIIEVTVNAFPPEICCPDIHHPHMIDLGLPSGTKWACCNVGADKPEDHGGLYAWGETEEKDYYDWDNYIFFGR